jgi:1,5-anhydro-D-fructose reductase (1,5-anhydro-D-mannitol-forming)
MTRSTPTAGPLRFGVIGIGNVVTTTIAPAMRDDPTCALVAAVSRDQARADTFAAEFGVEFATTDYEAMLRRADLDAVFIATPNALHAEEATAAARAGKHVLCDKPLATSVEDARAVVEAASHAGVMLGVNFHNRFLPWVRDATEMVADGVIGDVEAIEVHVGAGTRTYTGWRADPALAGLGSTYNVGVHVFDFLGVILGAEPVEVSAMFDRSPNSGDVEMLALVLIRFDGGTPAYVNCNERIAHPRNDITIYGTAGRIVGENLTRSRSDGTLRILAQNHEREVAYPAPPAHRLAIAGFAASVLAGELPCPSGVDGLRSMLLCDAIATSVIERRVVDVARLPSPSPSRM